MLLLALVALDVVYSFFQHYHFPLDGDLAAIVLPAEWYGKVLQNPFGFAVLAGEKYGAPNRFFVHWFMSVYFRQVPIWLQAAISPFGSIYGTCAILKITAQLIMAGTFARYIIPKSGRKSTIMAIALMVPLFQTSGYSQQMGLIESSITYACFYSVPLALLLVYFLPFFRKDKLHHPVMQIGLAALGIALPLSGPLVPALVLIICPMVFAHYLFARKPLPRAWAFQLGLITAWSLWSMYVGSFNVENPSHPMPLVQRYAALLAGIGSICTLKLGLPMLLGTICLNLFLIKKQAMPEAKGTVFFWAKHALFFMAAYLLLLPFGGFRIYRPLIVRHDTMMPVTMVLVLLYGLSSFYLLHHAAPAFKRKYIGFLCTISLAFTLADLPEFWRNACEQSALETIAVSTEKTVALPMDCPVMSWQTIRDTSASKLNLQLLQHWGLAVEVDGYFSIK